MDLNNRKVKNHLPSPATYRYINLIKSFETKLLSGCMQCGPTMQGASIRHYKLRKIILAWYVYFTDCVYQS